MCNLYKLETKSQLDLFGRNIQDLVGNAPPEDVYPGGQGIVFKSSGELRTMTWGFPLKQTSKKTGKPIKPKAVNNARSDKLLTPFWKGAFTKTEQRCLIPVTAFAEAVGEVGKMTRTWLSVEDEPVFACAGIWRDSDEWGQVYSMVMTDARSDMLEIHDRMPVILKRAERLAWLEADADDALRLCIPYDQTLVVNHTEAPWVRRKA